MNGDGDDVGCFIVVFEGTLDDDDEDGGNDDSINADSLLTTEIVCFSPLFFAARSVGSNRPFRSGLEYLVQAG